MENQFSFKELYQVSLKATQNMEIKGRTIEEDETIINFDKIQIATFQDQQSIKIARGGYHNTSRIWWENINGVQLQFSQGIFSKVQLAFMTNAKLIDKQNEPIMLNQQEVIESDEEGIIAINKAGFAPLFIYNFNTGEKINYQIIDNKHFKIDIPFLNCLVDYWYEYNNYFSYLQIGQPLSNQYFKLVGRTKFKDEFTGNVNTGIIQIPKLKIMSDLSIKLGSQATPIVGDFSAIAMPIRIKDNQRIMEICFLSDDIDSDL